MNYQRLHDAIIMKARNNKDRSKRSGFFEEHHIMMTSIGGNDEPENKVLLTPKEHFIIHYLLWKMHPGDKRYRDPILFFKHKGAQNSRLYEAARIEHMMEMRTNNPSSRLSVEAAKSRRQKLSTYAKNRSKEHNEKISLARKGKPTRTGAILTSEQKMKISSSVKSWFEENEVSEETRRKISEANTGRRHTAKAIEKQKRAAHQRVRKPCPNCGKMLDPGNLAQHVRNGW